MAETQVPVNRTLVGLLALGCVLAGGGIGYVDSLENVWCGSFVRTGVFLGALWLALPSRGRAAAWANLSPWVVAAALGAVVLFARRPRVALVLTVLIVIAAVVIRPRQSRPPNRDQ